MGKGVGVCSVRWGSSHSGSQWGRGELMPFAAVPMWCLRLGNVLLCCSICSTAGDQGANARAVFLLISIYAKNPNELQHCAQSSAEAHSWVWGAGCGPWGYPFEAVVTSPAQCWGLCPRTTCQGMRGPIEKGVGLGGWLLLCFPPPLLLFLLILLIFNSFSLSVIAAHSGSLGSSRLAASWGGTGAGVSSAHECSTVGPTPPEPLSLPARCLQPHSSASRCFSAQHRSGWEDFHFAEFLQRVQLEVYFQGMHFYSFSFCHCDCLQRGNHKQKPHQAKPQLLICTYANVMSLRHIAPQPGTRLVAHV